jgi:prepilin signal peptidase PulO-like enzyme (type II secretory pathway)
MDFILFPAFFLLGAMLASLAGVIAARAYTGQAWARSRSRCDSCNVTLSPHDLVPVFSWLSSGGRCRTCGSKVSSVHLFGEVALGTAFAVSYTFLGLSTAFPVFLAALTVLMFAVLYDLRHTLVPVSASVSLVFLSGLYAYLATPNIASLSTALITAGAIGLFFLALHVFSRGRAMGLADAPIAFALSLLTAPYAFAGLLFSFWIGAVWGIAVLVGRRRRPTMGIEVPFVPFLALGFLLAFFVQWNPLPL